MTPHAFSDLARTQLEELFGGTDIPVVATGYEDGRLLLECRWRDRGFILETDASEETAESWDVREFFAFMAAKGMLETKRYLAQLESSTLRALDNH